MKSIFKSCIFFSMILTGCQSGDGEIEQGDSGEVVNKRVSEVVGIYNGEIPCADCEAIDLTLHLKDDLTYESTLVYKGKPEPPHNSEGSYEIRSDATIRLSKENEGFMYFKDHPEGLSVLGVKGEEIEGDRANEYLLHAVTKEGEISMSRKRSMLEKWEQGIEFYALGNEPSWNVNIDTENGIVLNELNGREIKTNSVKTIEKTSRGEVRYMGSANGSTVIVTVVDERCIDNMSGEKFEYKVIAEVKNESDSVYKAFEGCGRYVKDPRLDGVWALQTLDGTPVDSSDFGRILPTLEFKPLKERFTGHDGCNSISGKLELKADKIRLYDMMATKMACPNMQMSVNFTEVIMRKDLRYEIEGGKLRLISDERPVAIFTSNS